MAGSWPLRDSGEHIITASKLRCTPEFPGWIREAKRNKGILPIQYTSHLNAWEMHRDNIISVRQVAHLFQLSRCDGIFAWHGLWCLAASKFDLCDF